MRYFKGGSGMFVLFTFGVFAVSYLVGCMLAGEPAPWLWPTGLQTMVAIILIALLLIEAALYRREKSYADFLRRKAERDGEDLDLGDLRIRRRGDNRGPR